MVLDPTNGHLRSRHVRRRWWLILPARPWAVAAFRRHLGAWLDQLRWPDDALDALVTVTDELVCNVVEHAYPPVELDDGSVVTIDGVVAVRARVVAAPHGRCRQVRLVVRDDGLWNPLSAMTFADADARADPAGRGHPGGQHGLQMAKELMDDVAIHRGAVDAPGKPGTVVTVRSPAVPQL